MKKHEFTRIECKPKQLCANERHSIWHHRQLGSILIDQRKYRYYCTLPVLVSGLGSVESFPRYWPFVNKGQWRGALMFSLVYTRTNGWTNHWDAADLRRHRAHYDVTVMDMTKGELWSVIRKSSYYTGYNVQYVFTAAESYGILQKHRSIRLVLRKLRINLSASATRSRTIDWKQLYIVV